MVKNQILKDLKTVVKELGYQTSDIVLAIPKNPSFGDYSTNLALQLSKLKPSHNKQNPKEIANKILQKFGTPDYLEKAEVAGKGFTNFFIKQEYLVKDVEEILGEDEGFGKSDLGNGKEIEIEFISANPTGPLTLANGRGGVLGDSLANILTFSGYKVFKQYYVNDTGNQIRLLGESILTAAGKMKVKEEHYKGDYIAGLAKRFEDKLDLDPLELGHLASDYFLEDEIKPAISKLGIKFDQFYSERSIYDKGLIEKTVQKLQDHNLVYEKDGALWFKATKFGDDKDRVLMTSDGERGRKEPTYFLADIAHHIDDLSKGYERRINILGADHHSYVKRIEAAMDGLGYKGTVRIIIMQLVKLFKEGKEVKMSKRAGTYVALEDLLEEVNGDAIRFFFLMRSSDSHIDFNLDLAKQKSNENPVFYVQYAHARMSNIIAKVEGKFEQPDLSLLKHSSELSLIRLLADFPEVINNIAQSYQVQNLVTYVMNVADLFHKFYESCPVLQAEDTDLVKSRLALVKGSKIVLSNSLKLLGISVPERM